VLLDGHGKEGRKVSLFCRDYMMNYFYKNHELFEQDPLSALEEVIESCDNELLSSGIECNLSGTTAVVVIINTLGIHAGSVGDSRSVLASLPKDISDTAYTQYKPAPFKRPVKPIRNLNAVPLTIDQKPNHEEELKRIYKAGGVVEKLADNMGRPVGPYRVWKRRSNLPGLAMSRSIGDGIAHSVGVISSPITHSFPLYTAYDQFIILASDGVWDVMDNLEVVNLIERFRNTCQNSGKDYPAKTSNSTIARLVCEEARYRWFGIIEDDDVMIDDISCIIIELFYGESVLKCDERRIEDRKINKFRSIAIENAVKGQMGVVRKDPTRGSMASEQAVIEEAIVELQSEEETQ
jgi:serine/threonine protein phosphatase PrpC